MFGLDLGLIVLFAIALPAAAVNGALGYGFSSMTVPVALLFFPNKILSPALVLVELGINLWVVALNRSSFRTARRLALPIVLGLVAGIFIGSYLLTYAHPGGLRFWTYAVLLPLILTQAAGYRRPIRAERAAGVPLGFGVGLLYATTTISGPPLALMFNNQGMDKEQFRATLGSVRVTETILTSIMYGILGLYSSGSAKLIFPLVPAVLIGLPLGSSIIRYLPSEIFRRICMSFDGWIVGFGLARTTLDLRLLSESSAYSLWAIVIAIDLYLLYRFFAAPRLAAQSEPLGSGTAGAPGLEPSRVSD